MTTKSPEALKFIKKEDCKIGIPEMSGFFVD
jgi:hypothetical protein